MKRIVRIIILLIVTGTCLLMSVQAARPLKLVSYNIWNGFEGDSLRRHRFVDWTRSQSPDIMVLTELVGFKAADLQRLGRDCGFSYSAISKEEGYSVGVLSRTPIEVEARFKAGFWHGMMHVRTAGLDVIATHLSPFEWQYRRKEAQKIADYIRLRELKDYYVAGDLNAHSPLDADELATHDSLLVRMRRWDASQPTYRNLHDGRFEYSVISTFLSAGLEDALGRMIHPAVLRMSYPAAFLYNWKIDKKELSLLRERIDYILLSPSLMQHCVQAAVHPVEGVSDHYPVSVLLKY